MTPGQRRDLEAKINCTERKIARLRARGGMYSLESQRLKDLLDNLRERLEEAEG